MHLWVLAQPGDTWGPDPALPAVERRVPPPCTAGAVRHRAALRQAAVPLAGDVPGPRGAGRTRLSCLVGLGAPWDP